MKLLRVGPLNAEKPAALDGAGVLRDLSAHVGDIDGETLSPAGLAALARIDLATLPAIEGAPRIGACIARPVNFLCIGLNYADHAAEAGVPIPDEPIMFLKSLGAICGPNDDVLIPRGSSKTDWEVELGVVIGTKASYISADEAMDHVAGYCVVNDVSERAFQVERGGTWDKGKGCDTFGPIGPWLVTADEIADPQDLKMWCDVDGERMQDGNTRTMIFDVRTVVAYASQFMTLYPGDIIATGTPPGVGLGIKPEPRYLKAGQSMAAGIAGMGEQSQRLVQA
ncbi:fumarylacetoacetate hydrolase family protein [Sphingomonas sp. ZT3P38]|uniref:fumarylacetoacetate hydrolase family protein n=1 Tax=Parasphingomonas zepuensis TaxID=3096161 RepID=UPI002FC8737E